MKEITRINLASLPYNVEIEAKKELEKYCAAIERNLGADAEAMREIEARMSELLADRGVTGEKVITNQDVEALKTQLGEAKDFAGDDAENYDLLEAENHSDKPERRLMRDTSRRMLGGVCAGFAAYFNTDIVLMRALAIVITFITAGAMILIYLLLWVIIPPARTAAERLQMAGKPVTLAALKNESEQEVSTLEPPLLVFLRYAVAGGLLAVALSVLAFLAFRTVRALPVLSSGTPQMILYVVIVALSGVFFMALCVLLAYALIAKRFSRVMGTILIVIMIAGLASFATGVLGYRGVTAPSYQQKQPIQQITKTLDKTQLQGVKRLTVTADPNTTISYSAKAGTGKAILSYPIYAKSDRAPEVTVTKDGDSATMTVKGSPDCSWWCQGPNWIDIEGQALDEVIVNNGQFIYNQSDTAGSSFKLVTHNDAKAVINSLATLASLAFSANGNSDIDATGASIDSVAGALAERGSIEVGNVKNIEYTAPASCPRDRSLSPTAEYASADSIIINGEALKNDGSYPCFTIQKADD